MGKELETAVVTKAGTQGGGRDCAYMCCGLSPEQQLLWGKVGPAKQPWFNWETSRSMPWAPQCLVLGFCLYFFAV